MTKRKSFYFSSNGITAELGGGLSNIENECEKEGEEQLHLTKWLHLNFEEGIRSMVRFEMIYYTSLNCNFFHTPTLKLIPLFLLSIQNSQFLFCC